MGGKILQAPEAGQTAEQSHGNDAYRHAGVDIDAGNALVNAIKPFAKATARLGCTPSLGGFGAFFDPRAAGYSDPILVATTDGVGTKLKLAIETKNFDTLGIDLVAMCVNDLIVQGAEPLFFLDYFATGRLDVTQGTALVRGIAAACQQSGCALIGGETAEMPGLYADGDFDLAGFAVGAVERGAALTGRDVKAGDVVLGLASSGVHSNGFALVRRVVLDAQLSYEQSAPFAEDQSLGAALLTPTRLYVKPILAALRAVSLQGSVRALAHITGGGLIENIPRVLPTGLGVKLDVGAWPLLPAFAWLAKLAKLDRFMLARTFNCGIGMVVVAAPEQAEALSQFLQNEGESVFHMGHVVEDAAHSVQLHGVQMGWPQ